MFMCVVVLSISSFYFSLVKKIIEPSRSTQNNRETIKNNTVIIKKHAKYMYKCFLYRNYRYFPFRFNYSERIKILQKWMDKWC